MARAKVQVRPLAPDDWDGLARLFGERGACGGCWCMAWRLPNAEWVAGKGEGNRAAFRALVRSGRATGVLAFDGDASEGATPIGWCSVGPRAAFAGLQRKVSLRTEWDERTWSVTCFFLAKGWRGRGVGARLLDGAVRVARDAGAARLEGYPVVPTHVGDRPASRMPAAFVWTGLPGMFERAGFRPLPDPPGKRPVYVRELEAPRRARRAKS